MDAGAVGEEDAHGEPGLGGGVPAVGVADVGAEVADVGVEWVQDHADDPASGADADGLPEVVGGEVFYLCGGGEGGGEESGESGRMGFAGFAACPL